MAPQLKQLVSQNIFQQETVSVINHVMESRDGPKIQDPAIREMVDDLLESNNAKTIADEANEKTKNKNNVPVDEKGQKYSKDLMTDEENEGYAIWIKTSDVPDLHYADTDEHKEAKKHFQKYVHHHYIKVTLFSY